MYVTTSIFNILLLFKQFAKEYSVNNLKLCKIIFFFLLSFIVSNLVLSILLDIDPKSGLQTCFIYLFIF